MSTLTEPTTGNMSVGSDSWIAQRFSVSSADTNLYTLDRVELLLDLPSGTPSDFGVSIYEGGGTPGDGPQNQVATLTGSSDPTSAGIYNYAAAGLTVSSATDYYVVVSAATPLSVGSYTWSSTDPSSFSSGSWTIHNTQSVSSNGSDWSLQFRERTFQMALYATPVPEPTIFALLGLGSLVLVMVRRRE